MKPSLSAAARAAFRAIRARAPNDRFYFFALCTTPDGVAATAWSEEAHAKAARAPRYAAFESPFREALPGFEPRDAECFDVLRELDGDGLFGRGVARSKTIINVCHSNMTDDQWLANADRLNSRAALRRALPFLKLRTPSDI